MTEVTDFNVSIFQVLIRLFLFLHLPLNTLLPLSPSDTFFGKDSGRKIGGTYVKVIYREYTDATFTTLKSAPDHLGLFGEESK